jgi:polysaccharide biosynthesis transport protein
MVISSDKNYQSSPAAKPIQLNESDEGGLNLGQVADALRRRGLLIVGVTGLVATGAVLKAEKDPLLYTGQFEILTKPITAENQIVANIPQSLSNAEGTAPPEVIDTTIQVLQSPRVLNSVVNKLKTEYPDLDYENLSGSLNVATNGKKSTILQVQYTSLDKKQVRDVLEAVAEAYLNYSLNERQEEIQQAIQFVQERISEKKGLQEKVELWQEQLRIFRSKYQLVEPQQKAQEISTHIAALTQQMLENRVQLEQMVSRYQQLQIELAQQPTERAGNTILTDNARYQRVLDEIQKLDVEIKQQSAKFTDENPTILTLLEKRANLLPMLQAEEDRVLRDFQSRIKDLQRRDTSLAVKIKSLNSYLGQLATASVRYEQIQQQLKISSDNLTQFLTKRQALRIELAQKQQPWKLLNPSEIKSDNLKVQGVSSSAKQNLALGTLLGLLLGTGAALVVDKLSNVFHTSKDLRETTGLPLLGVVPFSKELLFHYFLKFFVPFTQISCY